MSFKIPKTWHNGGRLWRTVWFDENDLVVHADLDGYTSISQAQIRLNPTSAMEVLKAAWLHEWGHVRDYVLGREDDDNNEQNERDHDAEAEQLLQFLETKRGVFE